MPRQKTGKNDRDAVCPYFSGWCKNYIRCEGDVPDTFSRIEFFGEDRQPDTAAVKLHYRIFCADRFKYCEHYRAVRRKYAEEEDE